MKRKLLPVFLSFALLANGSLTAFAADPVADAVTESDVQTTVSEDQENQEEVTVPEGESSEEEASTEADDSKETSDVITDIAGRYTELGTDGNPIDGSKAIENAKAGSGVIVDVRTPENYNKGYIEGSISAPVFTSDGVVKRSDEPTAVAFTETVTGNSALEGKEIYVLCNSGNAGAKAATVLLNAAGYSLDNIHTITYGATGLEVRYAFLGTNNAVTGAEAVAAVDSSDVVIIDVRTTENYTKGHLKNSISLPVFYINEKGEQAIAETNKDSYAVSFADYVKANISTFSGKKVYVLCNSGQRGARAATALLADNGVDKNTIYTITDGAKDKTVNGAFVTVDGYKFVSGNDAINAAKDGTAYVIDVRSSKAQAKTGILKGSISQSLFDADNKLDTAEAEALEIAFKEEIPSKITEDKPIYIICNSGARAATALLKAAGYDLAKVHTITGGAKNEDVKAASIYVSDTHVINKMSDTKNYLILDVRSTESYTKGHLKGSLSLPLFDKDNKLPDDLAKAFTEYVAAHKADFEGKTIYVLCNSGARGAAKATQLLKEAGITNVFTIENGAKSEVIQKHFVTDPVADPDTKKDNNGKG